MSVLPPRFTHFGFGTCLLAMTFAGLNGCGQPGAPSAGLTSARLPGDSPEDLSPDKLRSRLDDVLQSTLDRRNLNLREHAAWQILHGVLAYQGEFLIVNDSGDLVSALDHVLNGGQMTGWTMKPGVWLDEAETRRGLRAILEVGSKTGQGHADQWLAILAQCGLEPSQKILVDGQEYTMQDLVDQVLWDVPRNPQREYSWTLIGLTTYLPTDHSWTASDGEVWSIEKLVGIEVDQDRDASACGGTHRMIGMTMALNRHLAQGGKIEGNWKRADELIQQTIELARNYQNPDGSFSTNYFRRAGGSPDLAQNLSATGHTLEFLTLAMTDEQLHEPWVQRAVVNMCQVFDKTRDVPLECGALYHAAHGLVLYRQRCFGERIYTRRNDTPPTDPQETPSSSQATRPGNEPGPGKST